jgi:hypothetical protein
MLTWAVSVKLPKSFVAINLSEISPHVFGPVRKPSIGDTGEEKDEQGLERDQYEDED